jgi:hypothetical protein
LRVAPAADGVAMVACATADVATGLRPGLSGLSPATTQAKTTQAAASSPMSSWRSNITFKAMGWGFKERSDGLQLLAGDRLDIAYTLGLNDHPEFGGLELTLRDLKCSA